MRRFINLVGLTVLLLFLLACWLPCVDCGPAIAFDTFDFESGTHPGWYILLFGWIGGNNGVPWSANVFLAFGVVFLLFRQLRTALILGMIASVLGLSTWWVRRYDTLVVGYYLWQESQFVLVFGAIWALRAARYGDQFRLPLATTEARTQDITNAA
jgi:hypothetical protein